MKLGPIDPRVHLYLCNEFGEPDSSFDYGTFNNVVVFIQPNADQDILFSRIAVVRMAEFATPTSLPDGRYVVKLYVDASGNGGINCDQISNDVRVDNFSYNFTLGSDHINDWPRTCIQDFDHDGDNGTDQDIEAFFRCLAGNCCATCPPNADFNGDGDVGTDPDIEAFFRVLAGGNC